MNVRYLLVFAVLALLAARLVAIDLPSQTRPVCSSTTAPGALRRRAPSVALTPAFRAAGLSINTPVSAGADARTDDGLSVELAFWGSSARTSLAIEYRHEAGGLLDIDHEASRLTHFTDDLGTDLMNEEAPFGPFERLTRVSDDGRHLVFVVPSDALPGPGATRVCAAGVVAVRAANGTIEVPFAVEAGLGLR